MLQERVGQFMLGGELFGTACLVARRELGFPDAHLVTRADIARGR